MDLSNKELKYFGELEWNTGAIQTSLFTLLFTDILVFIEKVQTQENEKRYLLKPLVYSLEKKQTFTPVVPTNCIYSLQPIQMDKRGFYIVVIINENNSSESQKSSSHQMLFNFTAKSGDERSRWLMHFKAVMNKKKRSSCEIGSQPQKFHNQQKASTVTKNSNCKAVTLANNSNSALNQNIDEIKGKYRKIKNEKSNFSFYFKIHQMSQPIIS